MANVLIGNQYKHRVFCYGYDQAGINTRYFRVASLSGAAPSEAAFVAAQDTLLAIAYKPALSDTAIYVGSDIQNITGALPHPVQVGTIANSGVGTGGANPLPQQVSGLISTKTSTAGRGYRGRAYIPFPSTNFVNDAPPPETSAAYQTLLQTIASLTVGTVNVTVGGTVVAIVFNLLHSMPPAIKGSFTDTTGYNVGLYWATQRRRGNFGRLNPQPVP